MSGPERIWVKPCFPCSEPDDYYLCHPQHLTPGATSYVRLDIHDEVVKALRDVLEIAERNERGAATARARAALARMGEG